MVCPSSHINNVLVIQTQQLFVFIARSPGLYIQKNKVSKNITKSKRQTSELQFVCGTTVEDLVGPDAFIDLMSGKIYDVTQPLKQFATV